MLIVAGVESASASEATVAAAVVAIRSLALGGCSFMGNLMGELGVLFGDDLLNL
jgi:hypothetical protein